MLDFIHMSNSTEIAGNTSMTKCIRKHKSIQKIQGLVLATQRFKQNQIRG